ncbi:unnamed protein product [Larinioides sclopetarius]|uniref:Translational initiation factor 1 n=1 Tax=Larinioides sclopetarius TaxID=280406 RepID=A0AAV1ZVL6_9ARAC
MSKPVQFIEHEINVTLLNRSIRDDTPEKVGYIPLRLIPDH